MAGRKFRREGEDFVWGNDMEREKDEQAKTCEEWDACTEISEVIVRDGIQEMAEYHMICDETGAFVRSVEIVRQVKGEREKGMG